MVGLVRLALQRADHVSAIRWVEPVLDQPRTFPITALGVAFRDFGDDRTALRAFARTIDLGDPYAMEYAARIAEAHGNNGRRGCRRGELPVLVGIFWLQATART